MPTSEAEEPLTGVDHSYLKDDTLKKTTKWGNIVTLYYTSDKEHKKGLSGKVSQRIYFNDIYFRLII